MNVLIIYRLERNQYGRVIGKLTLRAVRIDNSFIGFGKDGVINRSEFQKLSDILEPYNEGFMVS